MNALSEVMEVRGVKVYVHWTVFALSGLFLLGAFSRPRQILVGLFSYYGLILLHECGHMVLAQRKRCHVNWIRLYPILGLVSYDEPYSRFEHAVIAWGGVFAQAVITVPVLTYVSFFGFTKSESINTFLWVWGEVSLGLIMFNLIPVPPLDGATAWKIIPEFFKRIGRGRNKSPDKNPYRFRGY